MLLYISLPWQREREEERGKEAGLNVGEGEEGWAMRGRRERPQPAIAQRG